MKKLIFLPGASGSVDFWQPLIDLLPAQYEKQIIAYPGFGGYAKNQDIQNFQQLTDYVVDSIPSKSILIAQSMGGIFAIAKALRQPEQVLALVLIATSGGIDLSQFNVQDWRTDYQRQYPDYPEWFMSSKVDYEAALSEIKVPVLLIWGDQDPISPLAVAQHLQAKFVHAQLHIILQGQHDLAQCHALEVNQVIGNFLKTLTPEAYGSKNSASGSAQTIPSFNQQIKRGDNQLSVLLISR